jgi:hypothetical protein
MRRRPKRYLFLLALARIESGARLEGIRQRVQVGEWAFTDGNVSWHLRRRGSP